MKVPVYLDYLEANQLIAAADTRTQVLEAHAHSIIAKGGDLPNELSKAIIDTVCAELALRQAFDVLRDVVAEAPEMHGDVPMALHVCGRPVNVIRTPYVKDALEVDPIEAMKATALLVGLPGSIRLSGLSPRGPWRAIYEPDGVTQKVGESRSLSGAIAKAVR